MLHCCREVSRRGIKIFLLGGTQSGLETLKLRLRSRCEGLKIVGSISPPYRTLSDEEQAHIIAQINESGAQIVWIGLGCPKQEQWMLANRGRVNAVMIGVGAAFDFHAGTLKRAPMWMQRIGLEWLHRLIQDPKRLASRYLIGNTAFVIAATSDLLGPILPLRRPVP
jgi:N-acetylglucosaminyldiphosphoundecaprenol N-acetyl-beta-D-mannosaminyltransferase